MKAALARFWHLVVLGPLVIWYLTEVDRFTGSPSTFFNAAPMQEWWTSFGRFSQSTGIFLALAVAVIAVRLTPRREAD